MSLLGTCNSLVGVDPKIKDWSNCSAASPDNSCVEEKKSLRVMRGIISPALRVKGAEKAAGQKRVVAWTRLGRGQNRGQRLSGSEKDRRISWDRSPSGWDKSMQCRGAASKEPRTEARCGCSVQ